MMLARLCMANETAASFYQISLARDPLLNHRKHRHCQLPASMSGKEHASFSNLNWKLLEGKMKHVTVREVPAAEGRLTEQRQVSARWEALISSARQINMVQVCVNNRLTGVLIPKRTTCLRWNVLLLRHRINHTEEIIIGRLRQRLIQLNDIHGQQSLWNRNWLFTL